MAENMIAKHIAALEALKGATVEAGWFETDRYPTDKDGSGGELVAERARKLEYGWVQALVTSRGPAKIVVPARPFMRYAYELFLKKRRQIEFNIAKKIISGKIDAEQALGQIGLALENSIVDSIKNGPWVPNAPMTVKLKGFNKPLIETSHMWQTVSSKVTI